MPNTQKQYAVYKGDDLIAMGSLKECAETLNVSTDTIIFYGTPTYQSRGSAKNRRMTIKLEDD